jgi:hypothetical protein
LLDTIVARNTDIFKAQGRIPGNSGEVAKSLANVDALPEKLKNEGLFCVWKHESRNGKQTKVPYNPRTGGKAQSNNPATFAPIDVAEAVQHEYNGIGLGVFGNIAALDIDGCINEKGQLSELAKDVVTTMNSYTEISPSKNGIHIIIEVPGFVFDKSKYSINNRKLGLEVYVAGATHKYVTVTGNSLNINPNIEERTEELKIILDKYMIRKPPRQKATKTFAPGVNLEDQELVSRACKAKNGELFSRLFSGDWSRYQSQSEADQALCNMLAFWTGRDPEQMDRLFRQSGLYREKWEREDYRNRTIEKAMEDVQEVYTGGRISAEEAFGELDWDGNLINKPDNNGQEVRTNQLPYIQANNRSLPSITDQAIKALVAKNWPPELFIRSGNIAKIINTKEKDNRGRVYNRPVIKLVNEPILRDHLARSANYVKVVEKKGELVSIPAIPPKELVQNVLVQDNLPLPLLRGITQAPIMRWDGSIFSTPGYDDATSLYYAPEGNFKLAHVPDKPTPGDVKAAVELLRDVIRDFPFDSKASEANLIAAIVTTVLHDLVDGHIPMLLVDKPLQGTGATLLTDVISIIATGKTATIKTAPKGDDRENEWRKTITAILSEGREIVVIDNLEDVFRSENICALLTSTTWSARILGKSEDAEFPNRTIWIATGNNIRLAGDLPRRCYKVRLDANTSKPWERDTKKFKYPNLLQHVKKNRGALLAAVYTMTRAWIYAGRPTPVLDAPTMGSFEEWQATIGGILEFSGVTEFLQNNDQIFESAEINDGIEGFIEAWHEVLGEIGVTTKELQRKITFNDTLRDALPDWLDPDERGFTRKLGRVLATKVGVYFTNGYKLKKDGVTHKVQRWKVCKIG